MSDDKKAIIHQKLANTRQALLALLSGLDEAQWETAVFHDEGTQPWRVVDLLGHLVNAESSMTRLMQQIQQGGEGAPPDFDLHRWNARAVAKARDKTPAELMAELAPNRQILLEFIETIRDEDWQKKGRHASQRILSIEEICHLIADHEQRHMQDIQNALG